MLLSWQKEQMLLTVKIFPTPYHLEPPRLLGTVEYIYMCDRLKYYYLENIQCQFRSRKIYSIDYAFIILIEQLTGIINFENCASCVVGINIFIEMINYAFQSYL